MADYNINAVTRKVVYTGSAGLGPYSFSFEVLISTDVAVYFNTTLLTLSTDYSVTVNANGTGSVTIITGTNVPTTPDADDAITIVGARDIERTTDFSTGGDFQAVAINEQLDANIIFIQQIDERVDRSIKAAVTDPTSINMELPVIATRANKVMAFDSSGNVSVSTNTLSAIEDTIATTAASAAAALVSENAAAASESAASSSASTASTQATLSTNYATKIDGAVTGSDYASKAWAIGGTGVTTTSARGAAKEWSTTTGAAVDTSEFSAKEYSQGTTVSTGSSKQWALGGAAFDVDTVVAGGVFSAKKYAANAAASAAQAASGQIYSTVVNQTGAALSPALSADGTYYLCDTSSNSITVTLPAIGTAEGTKYAFQKTSASNSLIFQRSGSDTLNGSASDITITDVNAQIQFVADDNSPDNWVGVQMSQITVGAGLTKVGSVVSIGDNAIVPSMVQGTVNAQTGTAYTSVIGDAFKTITMSNTSANKVTLPPNSSVAYAVGDRIDIVMLNSGVTSVQGGSGVTVNGVSTGTGAIAAQYGAVSCLKIATNTWLLMGNHGGVA
tara:strand:+ start:2159 stop:3838 length:1680 start_codon:yes stop_codon:yes gene_type:complete